MRKDHNIREYNCADKNAVVEILRLNTPHYFAEIEEDDFLEYLDTRIEQYFVIECDTKTVGCGGLNFFTDHARISWDMIHPDYQSKGIGRLLLTYRLDKLRQRGDIDNVVVRTSQHVYAFYQKQGFHLVEVIPDYWAKGFDLYKLEFNI